MRILKNPKAIITIEIGHGPYPTDADPNNPDDKGAIDERTGTDEWTLNKLQGKVVLNELKDMGYTDVLTLDPCDYLTAIGRKNRKSHVFVSIHHNAFRDVNAQGSEALCHKQFANKADIYLAAILAEKMSESLGIVNRGVKYRGLGVLGGFTQDRWRPYSAAVLTEAYFITGQDVDDHHGWSSSAAVAIAEGIHQYVETLSPEDVDRDIV